MIFPVFALFSPFLNAHLIAEEGKPLDDFPTLANYFIHGKAAICHNIVIS